MNALYSLIHDGPAPLPVRGFAPRRGVPAACHFLKGGSSSSQSQTTATTDSRVGVSGDNNLTVKDSSGTVNVTTSDSDVAKKALGTANDLGAAALDTAGSLGSDALDSAVALARQAGSYLESYTAGQNAFVENALAAAKDVSSQTNETVRALAKASNNLAGQVAASPQLTAEASSGLGSAKIVIGIAVVGAVGIAFALRPSK